MFNVVNVMLDPGHGGKDIGAANKYAMEKDLNLIVANACRAFLEKYEEIDVKMTRYQDTDVSLDSRCQICNLNQSNLFVSFHHNAGGGDGYEVYHYTGSLQGKVIANLLAEEFAALGQNERYVGSGLYAGSRPGNYYVLEYTNCPAALGEFGFMDTKDYSQFDEEQELISIGRAYARAILRYFNIEIKEEVKVVKEPLTLEERVVELEKRVEMLENLQK